MCETLVKHIINIYEVERRSARRIKRFLIGSLRGQITWTDNIFEMLKERSCQPKILCLAKLSFNNDGEIKALPVHEN